MKVKHNYREYEFRACDTKEITAEELQELADKTGKMRYEPNGAWLLIPEIGYGWEVR